MSCNKKIVSFISNSIKFSIDAFIAEVEFIGGVLETVWKEISYPLIKGIFGLFGFTDEELYPIQAVTQRIMPDIPASALQTYVYKSISGNTDVVANIKLALLTGPMSSAYTYLNYGVNTYANGLPTAIMENTKINAVEVENIIELKEAAGITLISAELGSMTATFWIKAWLYTTYDYDKALDMYLYSDGFWYSYSSYANGTTAGSYDITLSRVDDSSGSSVTVYVTTTSSTHTTATYYLVTYELDSAAGVLINWQYEKDLGTYDILDLDASTGVFAQDILPIVPLREEFYSMNDTTAPNYDANVDSTSRTIMNIVNLNYDELISNIEASPDIANVEDAFFLFAVNIYTTSQPGLHALYVLFNNFYLSGGITKTEYEANSSGVNANTVRIEEGSYKAALSYQWIEKTEVTGSIGSVGTHSSVITVLANTPPAVDGTGGKVNSYVLLRQQFSDTQYYELKIQGLFAIANIQTVAGVFKVYTIELSTDQATMNNFSIALSLDQLENMASQEKDELLYESLSITIYASQIVYLEWYETSAFTSLFSFVITVIAIVYFIYSYGESQGTAALLALAQQVLIQYVLQLILIELLTEYADNDTAKVIIAAAYTLASYYFGTSEEGLLSAETLLSLVNVANVELSLETTAFMSEQAKLEAEYAELSKELEDFDKELYVDSLNIFSVSDIMAANPYESPSQFYDRVSHNTNPGVKTLDQIKSYVDRALELPELTEYSFDSSYTKAKLV